MTTPDERTRAVLQTRRFLQELVQAPGSAVTAAVREEARRLLRHYPGHSDMRLAHHALPCWFGNVPDQALGRHEGAATRAAVPTAVWRVGIVQFVDHIKGRCTLADGLTDEVLRFVAKDDAARQRLRLLEGGKAVDYQLNERGQVVSVGEPPPDELSRF